MTKDEYQTLADGLVGEVIHEVEYFEIDYGTGLPQWSQDGDFDSLDLGLNLRLESGKLVAITWGIEFTEYGISFANELLENKPGYWRTGDGSPRWRKVLGSPVVSAKVYWSSVESCRSLVDYFRSWIGSSLVRTAYPQDLELEFENGETVIVSALEYRADSGSIIRMQDHLTIVFCDTDAERFELGRYAIT